ncbi:MAG TPA: EAL domain-containing protein [Thiobacillaceae bacterium]|nr:EAL domain-containing protein [Thiobacillaceae bacterium]
MAWRFRLSPVRAIRVRLVLLFVLLLAGLLVVTLYTVQQANQEQARAQAAQRFRLAGQIIVQDQAQRLSRLRQAAEALARGAAFRRVVASADQDVMEELLARAATHPQIDLAVLLSLDGRLLVRGRIPHALGQSFPGLPMPRVTQDPDPASAYARIDGQVHQLVLVPVMAPRPVAWLVLGKVLDDALALEYRDRTGTDVSFTHSGEAWSLPLASSMPSARRRELAAGLARMPGAPTGMHGLRLGDSAYWFEVHMLDVAARQQAAAVLTFARDAAMAPYGGLRDRLLVLAAVALPLGVLAVGLVPGRMGPSLPTLPTDPEGPERETGLLDRDALVRRVEAERAAFGAKRAVMLVAGLTRLSTLRVRLGWDTAHALLQVVAQRIQGRRDWQAASLGGERFAFYAPLAEGMDRDDWEVRVRAVLEVPVEWQGLHYDLGLRLGSAVAPDDGEQAALLLYRAEQAMQRGTHTLGEHVVWQAAFETEARHYLALQRDLREALDAGLLVATYQPRACLRDGRIQACALRVLWRHPVHGCIPTHTLFQLAEQSTLVDPLARWCIDTGAAQAAVWHAAGRAWGMAVPLPARSLENHVVVEYIANALTRHGLAAPALTLEIRAHAPPHDVATDPGVVSAVADLGVELCVVGFGTDLPGLGQLARLPLRALRIEREHVSRLPASARDAALVRAGIALAHNLGWSALADGVDTPEIWQCLAAWGCDQAQGDYLCPPLEGAALDAWLATRGA